MKLVYMLVVVGLSGWAFSSAYRGLENSRTGWRVAFIAATLGGLALGIWLVTYTYLRSPTVQSYGYPFDFGGAEFFDERWHGGLISPYMVPAMLADVALGLLLLVGPFRLGQLLAHVMRTRNDTKPETG